MKTEENVYEETTRAEETMAVSEERASTVPGKFKDVDALVRAYSSLQAEFTRRSQRLKELEKQAENFQKDEPCEECSGVEKLRKNAKARKEETKQFDQFVAETMEVNARDTKESQSLENSTRDTNPVEQSSNKAETEKNGGTMYEVNALTGAETARKDEAKEERENAAVESERQIEGSDGLYEQVCRNEEVRLKIIGEYLTSLGKTGAPLMTGGVGLMATPPQKPKSISEAGNMALLYFRKPKAN